MTEEVKPFDPSLLQIRMDTKLDYGSTRIEIILLYDDKIVSSDSVNIQEGERSSYY